MTHKNVEKRPAFNVLEKALNVLLMVALALRLDIPEIWLESILMLKEFKEFAVKGNVIDLAIGVIMGAAFGKIVSSFVSDILMPPIGLMLGKVDFSNLYLNMSGQDYTSLAEAKKAGAATLNYGAFINTTIDFLIVSFCVFLLVRTLNKMKRAEAVPAATTKKCPHCISDIPLAATKCAFCTSSV